MNNERFLNRLMLKYYFEDNHSNSDGLVCVAICMNFNSNNSGSTGNGIVLTENE